MILKTLEEQADEISNKFGERYSRVYDLLIYARGREAIRNPIVYVINKDEKNKHAFDIVYRLIRFETYMKVGREE